MYSIIFDLWIIFGSVMVLLFFTYWAIKDDEYKLLVKRKNEIIDELIEIKEEEIRDLLLERGVTYL